MTDTTDARAEGHAAPQDALPRGDPPRAARASSDRQRHAGARPDQDRGQHGRRRGGSRLQADRGCDQGPDRHHRPEADGDQGPQVHRPVQAARGHADRRPRHAARRPDVGVPRPAAVARAAPHPRLPRPLAASSSTARATTPSVSPSRSCSTRSTRTASTAREAWTSRSSPRPRTTSRVARCSSSSASRSRRTDHGEDCTQGQGGPQAEVRGPRLHPLPALRPPKAVYRKFGLCRICLREMAHRGELPGVTKSSW